MVSVTEAQQRLAPESQHVPRVRDLSPEDFVARFYAPARPVIIQGELKDWPALELWSPDYLKRKAGGAEIQCQLDRESSGEFELDKDRHKSSMAFDRMTETFGPPREDQCVSPAALVELAYRSLNDSSSKSART